MAGGGGFEAPEAYNKRQKKYQRGKKLGVRIDMTPMVDVIMLLLTFFMLTTTLSTPQVMQINLPKGDEEDKVKVDASNVLYVRVAESGNIYFSQGTADNKETPPEHIAMENLKNELETRFRANPNIMMLLKFDRNMKYTQMVDILDEINRAKIDKRYTFMPVGDMDKEIIRLAGG
ncbi:MAG: biopolymer transporter ExbD [Ignavibacteriae bacterium]|nr:biopolymer transporter ExbD [Ignavibacteriota bacterium]